MKRMFLGMLAAAGVAVLSAASASAQDFRYANYDDGAAAAAPAPADCYDCGGCGACDSCCDTGCYEDCCNSGGIVFEVEATFFRYHRADGVRVGGDQPGDDDVEFDFELSPRITVGYAGSDGLGVRLRWWDYDHTGEGLDNDDETIDVDTYTVDVELFDTVQLNCNWTAEISAGVRFNDFEEVMVDVSEEDLRINAFEGFGGVVGLELKRYIGGNSSLYAGVRGAILMDDKTVFNADDGVVEQDRLLLDSTQGMLELALGYEYASSMGNGATVFARAQGEWQNWFNYTSHFDQNGDIEDAFDGSDDAGFGGVAFSIGVAR